MVFSCDTSSLESVRELGKKVKNEVGNVTILVNNVDIVSCKPFEDHDEALIKKVFDINVFANFWVYLQYKLLMFIILVRYNCMVPTDSQYIPTRNEGTEQRARRVHIIGCGVSWYVTSSGILYIQIRSKRLVTCYSYTIKICFNPRLYIEHSHQDTTIKN